ncbi:MAG: 2-oxo acid dehydrogenase subunit E2 [Chloroflexi bacterium]|nr:2-oxo acid dehydrogenase subunit E2 [Chloroflexota bacterium]
MAKEIVMPRLSDTMEEGRILKWYKRPGEEVKKGEVLAEIETDKATMELESYDTGILTRIVVAEGGQAPIGQPIAYLGSPDEVKPGEAPGAAPVAAPAAPAAPSAPSATAAPAAAASGPAAPSAPSAAAVPAVEPEAPALAESDGRIKASPLARRIAQELGIDLRTVSGSGPGGRILREDVEAAARQRGVTVPPLEAPSPTPAAAPPPPAAPPVAVEAAPAVAEAPPVPGTVQPLTRMQQTIARRMVASKQQVPHFYVTTEVETDALSDLRQRLNRVEEEVKVSYNDLIVKAVALALREMPLLNSSWSEQGVVVHQEVNIGIAVALERGLVVPVIHQADQKSVRQIARENAAMFQRVRENKPRPEDFQGATFTVSNLGMYDVDEFIAIIDPPAVAILAVGSIQKKPVVVGDEVAIRERLRLTISADHRVVYGAEAAQFLQLVKRRLEQPYSLL